MSLNRRDFLKTSCQACLAVMATGIVGSEMACKPSKGLYAGKIRKGILRVPMKAFNEQQTLLVQTYNYKEPLILIRKKEGEVKALLMRCTHKGVGLEKIGEQLVCPAHGSIFDFDGKVLQSPAGEALTSFPAVADEKTVLVKIEQ